MTKHIRRWDNMPAKGRWELRCDCGWKGHAAQMDGLRHRGRLEVDMELEGAFLAHLKPDERRTYLLVDSRPPQNGPSETEDGQPIICGVFIMPEAISVKLLSSREEDGVMVGRYRTERGDVAELPIGEVRTPEGRVFRLDE